MSKKHTIIAIAYDFDGTIAKGNIQENSFIPELGITKKKFWQDVREIAKKNEMDEILAYMFLLITKAKAKDVKVDKTTIKGHGKDIKYFNGVEEYFERINKYARENNINLKHYIISSGTKEMIEGTSIAKHFEQIYASSFKYDQHDVAEWPALAINYTVKTQYLFRINKGIENVWDNSKINKFVEEKDRPIPFKNIIYIGDGETDIPAMKMVNYQGGVSIGVYPPNTRNARKKVEELLEHDRANYIARADYSENSEIDKIIRSIIDQTSAKERIVNFSKTK